MNTDIKVRVLGVIVPPQEATEQYGFNHNVSCVPIYDADDVIISETLSSLTRGGLIDEEITAEIQAMIFEADSEISAALAGAGS